MTDPKCLADYRKRIIDCKAKLLRHSPTGHPKVSVLDSFTSQIEAHGRFTHSQLGYLRSIEHEADRVEALSEGYQQFIKEGCYGGWTKASLLAALPVALQMCESYSNVSYYWRRHKDVLASMQDRLTCGTSIDLHQWDTIHRLKGFDNLVDAYSHGQKFKSGDLVQLRASINHSNIHFDGYGNWGDARKLYQRRREVVATVIEYDALPPYRLVQTDKNGSCRVVKILPIGSVKPVYITEKDLKKVPSKVIAGGAG